MKRLCAALCLSLISCSAFAADLKVVNAWIRLLPAGVPAAGYFELQNKSTAAAELIGASSPAFGQTMLHRSIEEKGRSTMLHLDEVAVPAGGKVVFAPGGYHLMLMQPTRALNIGEKVPLTLEFASGEKITAQFEVRGPSGR